MNTTTISTVESSFSVPNLVKRTCLMSVCVSTVLILLGFVLFSYVFNRHDSSSTSSMALLVLATGLVLYGVFRLFWRTKKVYYQPTGSEIKEYFMFFDLKDLNELKSSIHEGNFAVSPSFHCHSGGNIRLHALMTSDHQFAAVQLYQFVPYTYSPVTAVHYFKEKEALAFSAFIKQCKK